MHQLVIIFTLALGVASSSAQEPSPTLLEKYRDISSDLEKDRVEVPLISRTKTLINEILTDLPNFISTQRIARFEKRADSSRPQPIDIADIEMTVEEGSDGQQNETITVKALRDGSPGGSHVKPINPTDSTSLKAAFHSRALTEVGNLSLSLRTPFDGGELPTFLHDEKLDVGAGQTKTVKVYEYNTDPKRSLKMKTSGFSDNDSTRTLEVRARGKVFIDPTTALIERIEINGYGFPNSSPIFYYRQEVEYGWIQIDENEDRYWLPKVAITEMGPSKADYFVNVTQFLSYRKFTTDIKIMSD